MPTSAIEKQIQRFVKQRFELLTTSALLTVSGQKVGGRKCGTTEEQQEGGKAKEVLREARRQTCAPFLERWQNDDVYRASQVEKFVGQKKKVRRMDECALLTTVIKLRGKSCGGTDKNWTNTEEILVETCNKTEFTSFRSSSSDSGKNQICSCRSYHTTPHPKIPTAAGGAAAASAANTVER